MTKYYIYKITFLTTENNLQKAALDALNKYLPGQIIVNTSIPISAAFANGNYIGIEIEVESAELFSDVALGSAASLANSELNNDIISKIEGVGENIIDYENDLYTNLVDMSW